MHHVSHVENFFNRLAEGEWKSPLYPGAKRHGDALTMPHGLTCTKAYSISYRFGQHYLRISTVILSFFRKKTLNYPLPPFP